MYYNKLLTKITVITILIFILTSLFLWNTTPNTIYGAEPSFNQINNFPLSLDNNVIANWDDTSKSLVITGTGKIDLNKLNQLKNNHLGITDEVGWGSMDSDNPFSINIKDPTVMLPDNCENLFYNFYGDVIINSNINTSNIVNMDGMFWGSNANPDVSNWDVSKVTNFHNMFSGNDVATPNVSKWDVSAGINFSGMFSNSSDFTPDVANWNVSNGENFSSMFQNSISNPNVSKWNMENAKDLSYMFKSAKNANPDVGIWNVSKVENFAHMFSKTKIANPDVSKWDMSSAKDLSFMFMGASIANPDVTNWNVSNCLNFSSMFTNSTVANPNVSKWNTSKGEKFSAMFWGTKVANPDVSNWDMSSAKDLSYMFSSTVSANPDVSKWNTSNVENLQGMFSQSSATSIDVSNWNVKNVTINKYMMDLFRDSNIESLDLSNWEINDNINTTTMVMGMKNLKELKIGKFPITLAVDDKTTNRFLPQGVSFPSFSGTFDVIKVYNSNNKVLLSTHENSKNIALNDGQEKENYVIKLHKNININFFPNNGQSIDSITTNGNIGYILKEPILNNNNNNEYSFAGWYIDSEFKEKFDFSKPLYDSVNLYGKWEKVNNNNKFEKDKTSNLEPKSNHIKNISKFTNPVNVKTGDNAPLEVYGMLIPMALILIYHLKKQLK